MPITSANLALGMSFVLLASAPAAAVTTLTKTVGTTFSHTFSTTSQYTGNTGNTLAAAASPVISFAQFDTRGRFVLTGVSITMNRTLSALIELTNGSNNGRNGNLQYQMTSTVTNSTLGLTSSTVLGTASQAIAIAAGTRTISQGAVQIGGTVQNIFTPSTFTPYAGTGNITLTSAVTNFISAVTVTSGGPGSLSGKSSGSVDGNIQVVYTYYDLVPEPSSWAMLIAGFGLVGAAARRRRVIA
jgi:hypothetical protein